MTTATGPPSPEGYMQDFHDRAVVDINQATDPEQVLRTVIALGVLTERLVGEGMTPEQRDALQLVGQTYTEIAARTLGLSSLGDEEYIQLTQEGARFGKVLTALIIEKES